MKKKVSEQEKIMRESGFVTAAQAAWALGMSKASIHRKCEVRDLNGKHVGKILYVEIESLKAHTNAAAILERVSSL